MHLMSEAEGASERNVSACLRGFVSVRVPDSAKGLRAVRVPDCKTVVQQSV